MLSDVGLGLGAARAWVAIQRAPWGASPSPRVSSRHYTDRTWPGRAPVYDAYLPRERGASPPRAVVLIHGGGFVIGSRRMQPVLSLVDDLLGRGLAVIACDYPLARGRTTLRDQVEAVREALYIPERHASELGVSPDGFSAVGFSAGATLTLLAASGPRPKGLTQVVSAFGLYDFEALTGPFSRAFRRWVVGPRERVREASVIATGGPDLPVFLMHGEADSLVACEQALRFRARREALGLPVTLKTYAGGEHAFFSRGGEPAERGKADLFAILEASV